MKKILLLLQILIFLFAKFSYANLNNESINAKLKNLANEMIIYKALKEKHVVTIFTDISCGFCHKLHNKMKEYNDLGITVQYLAFPRNWKEEAKKRKKMGAAKDMESIWCTADRKKSLDNAMKSKTISPASCEIDLAKHYNLGIELGVQGTPSILLENGTILPGYSVPEVLNRRLNEN